jgi:hypothetical protein
MFDWLNDWISCYISWNDLVARYYRHMNDEALSFANGALSAGAQPTKIRIQWWTLAKLTILTKFHLLYNYTGYLCLLVKLKYI